MTLNELIQIDNRFEKSVNLNLDLYSQDKIDGYIPTRSSVNVLHEYIKEVKTYSGNRASVLIGPYGKGKSHLLLVLLTILAQTCQKAALDKLIRRISDVNEAAGEDIINITTNMGTFLPVIISGGGGSLRKAFLKGLSDALVREKLDDVVPDSYYSHAVKTIDGWKKNYPETYQNFLKKLPYDVKRFKRELNYYNEQTLDVFKELYPELTAGSAFNPIVDDEIISVYASVNRILREKYGYSGIYIVFDEFSKYIEGHAVAGFADDMKVLQDMCELCNSSKEEQLHITCVAHKSIKAYGSCLPAEVLNAFKGVEGRLVERLFVVSSQNNYELISDAIGKKAAFEAWKSTYPLFEQISEESYSLKIFKSLFDESDYKTIIGDGCFPFTPIAATLLLSLSEKVAQNERTIFTYITGKDSNGLVRLIESNKEADFIGIDSVYDYFEKLFTENSENYIHYEWLKADYALARTDSTTCQSIIKAIAVIRMVNNSDEIVANEKFIQLALGIDLNTVKEGLSQLEQDKLIAYKTRIGCYEFKNNVGIDLDLIIADTIAKKYTKIDFCDVLLNVVREKYVLPKKHNQLKCITRYFNYVFLTQEQFLKMRSLDYLKWETYPDGVVAFIVSDSAIDVDQIADHAKTINDPCLLVCLPNEVSETCVPFAKYYLAVRNLRNDATFVDNNAVLAKELENLAGEAANSINEWFTKTYFPVNHAYTSNGIIRTETHGFNRMVSDLCDAAYSASPIVNHELINRQELTAQISRARNSILNDMFAGKDLTPYESGSSAESTIYRATMVYTKNDPGTCEVRDEIDRFVMECATQKNSFSALIETLTKPPYGMRRGIIPFYIADCLLRLESMPVLYLKDKEVFFDVETVVNLVRHPEDYCLFVERKDAQKNQYIKNLEGLFSDYANYCRDIDGKNLLSRVACLMQSWYRSLPQTSMTFNEPDTEGQNIKQLSAFRRLLSDTYINPREMLLEKLPQTFMSNEYEKLYSLVVNVKHDIDQHIEFVKRDAVTIIRDTFGFNADANLRLCLVNWYDELSFAAKNSIFTARTTRFLEYIHKLETNDEAEIASRIVRDVTGMFIEDWKNGSGDSFKEALLSIIKEVSDKKNTVSSGVKKIVMQNEDGMPVEKYYDFDPDTLSATATFFKNSLEDILDEYEGVLENSEKIGVLMEAIKKLME